MLFRCQGQYYARYGELLFPEKIEVWKDGPVVRTVYENYEELKSSSKESGSLTPEEEEVISSIIPENHKS